MKNLSNENFIPVDLHFRKSGHSFNAHAKFISMKLQSNNPTKTP